ncbi:MAG: flavodoxin [Eubacteriales bacterium]|nr:flavodoxin [Eubacteriales bacterium]
MKRIKQFLAVFLGTCMILTLAACGNSSDSASDTESNTVASKDTKAIVVYFSASGNTERVAKDIAGLLEADTFQLIPKDPYTEEDLDWNQDGSRVNKEHEDESVQDIPLEKDTPDNWDDYNTVFLGYPIWWGDAAWPVNEFVKNSDFSGKTVIPFATSASSGIGDSGSNLAKMAGTGTWKDGKRFPSGASESKVTDWVKSLGL